MSHFVQWPATTQSFHCYHPNNFQSQYMTLNVGSHPRNTSVWRPNPGAAIRNALTGLDAFGILDFYVESTCLIYGHIAVDKHRIDQLDCRCSADGAHRQDAGHSTHVTHHSQGHRSDYDYAPAVMSLVDSLTDVDQMVYRQALSVFLCRMRAFEAWLGRRVLCDDTLEEAQPTLRYIEPDLLSAYHSTTACYV
jgi:hypothetical protein